MPPTTLWLNKNLSSIYNVIETIRAAAAFDEFRVLCTHTNPDCAAFRIADIHETEPRWLSSEKYLRWCLDCVERHQVNVFLPGKNLRQLVHARRHFEERGVRLIAAADAPTLDLLESKSHLYEKVAAAGVPIPDYRVVNDLAGFDAAVDGLRARHSIVCFKPCVSLFGLGFRILAETGNPLKRLLKGDVIHIGREEARQLLAHEPKFRDLMVMQYLPGPERSVDCLARDGELLRCVVRRKPTAEGGQVLEDNPAIEEMARRLTRHLRLNAVFNIQFRDCDGISYLLEINPRMSGGIHYACLSGVAFPYWAVRLALDTAGPNDIPYPQTGIRVGQVNRAIVL